CSVAVLCQFDRGNIGKKLHGNALTECSAWYPLDIPGASGKRATHCRGRGFEFLHLGLRAVECKVHSIPVERQWLHRAWLKREFIVDYMHLGDQRADTVLLRVERHQDLTPWRH